jgi:hypothetical protein
MLKQYSIQTVTTMEREGGKQREWDNLCKEHRNFIDVNSLFVLYFFLSLTRSLAEYCHCCFCWLINEGIDKAIVNWNVHKKKASFGGRQWNIAADYINSIEVTTHKKP